MLLVWFSRFSYYNGNVFIVFHKFMKEIELIIKLQQILEKNSVFIEEKEIHSILIDSLMYDQEIPKRESTTIKSRKKYIDKLYYHWSINISQLDITEDLERIKVEIKNITEYNTLKNNNVLCATMMEHIFSNWGKVFGIWSKKIKPPLNKDEISLPNNLDNICKILQSMLTKKPLLRYNWTKSIILSNYLLLCLWLPWINFNHKDKKKIIWTLGTYKKFKKEFLLAIISELYKLYYESIEPSEIVTIPEFASKKWVKYPYIKPGTWWYKENIKYTFLNK